MDITITSIKFCSGGGHISVDGNIDGVNFTVLLQKQDFQVPKNWEEGKETLALLARHYVKQNNLTTASQIKTFFEGKVLKI